MNFLFTADLHGNEIQYSKVFNYLNVNDFDFLILGGDLAPKSKDKRNPAAQKDFFKNVLFKLMQNSGKQTLLILGNDDYRLNLNFLRDNQHSNNYKIIDVPYTFNGYCIAGYSYVPYTPFVWKDWERRDLKTDNISDLRHDVLTTGMIDFDKPYNILDEFLKYSIEFDLENLCKGVDNKKLILITHTPPFNTVCDLMKGKDGKLRHIGSKAVRKFIEKQQPLLTLHGHIHDSVQNSKYFMQYLNNTISATVGNDHLTDDVYVLQITIEKNVNIERIKL
ncbi:MAG: metallophosphoesterase [Alphaproteobacteria bacterium]|nr:metallophosphoesterase [Alphaproteobacteria bacterium]